MKSNIYKKGQAINGYTISDVTHLESINSVMIRLTHGKTCARHIHISNKDTENTFGVFFRTVPKDSSGIAHILEHTVLCGSRQFNVRDPFFSMIKRSLSTFMNAFTASDWTMYPFSTQNKKDYYNLMSVYLDAVFFPILDELSFKQEGHRLEIADNDNNEPELIYKGVVYNEMKGAMSSPGQVMASALSAALYPDTTYRNNSGGDPSDIPKLTYENLKKFHARYYHPSNACFYTYGSLALSETLSFICNRVLDQFEKLQIESRVPSQPRWHTARTVTRPYAYSDQQNFEKKYQGCVAWLTCDIQNDYEILVLTVLEQILLGNSASPLRKALIDSNLGSALSDSSGFEPDNRDAMFSCGLKDIKKSAVKKVEEIIFSTIQTLADTGIEKTLIESAIHQTEFHRKEITNTPYPFGIKLLLSFAGTLIHDGDPAACINIENNLNRLKKDLKKGNFLEKKLKAYFIDNPHRVRLTLEPDIDLEKKTRKATRQTLETVLKKMLPDELAQIRQDTKSLETLREQKEDVSVLPTLELSDVPPDIEIIKPDDIKGVSVATSYNRAANGILYFTGPLGAGDIPKDLYALVPFFSNAFIHSGTRKISYDKMARLMDLYTGGISLSPFYGTCFSRETETHSFLAIQGKALDRNIDPLFDLIKAFIEDYCFSDYDRIKSLMLQYQAGLETSIVSAGHRYAISLSSRHLSQASFVNELWHGIAQYQMIKKMTGRFKSDDQGKKMLEILSEQFTTIARTILRKRNFKPALIGETASILAAEKRLVPIHETLTDGTGGSFSTPDITFDETPPFDGWYTSAAVSFVGQSFKTVRITHEDSPGLAVISKILRSLYLHREIREKGGAYGGFAIYNTKEGIFSFGSYRDPHIKRTLDIYQDACRYIMNGDYSQTDIKEAILQVCSEIDRPETPGSAAMKAFYRDITKLDDTIRQTFKDALLRLDKPKIQQIAQKYFTTGDAHKGTAIISNKESLEDAVRKMNTKDRTLELFKI